MVRRLLATGYHVGTYDPDESARAEMLSLGADASPSIAAAVDRRDIVLLSLPSDPFVLEVLTGRNGVFANASPGTVIVDASTISPFTARGVAGQALELGLGYVDAPITVSQLTPQRPDADGLEPHASAARRAASSGNLGFFVGGRHEDVERIAPVLEHLGLETHIVGPVGAGMTMKLFNNAIAVSQVALVSEMLVIAEREGLDLAAVVDALSRSSSNSSILNSHIRPFSLAGNFPSKLFPITYAIKDLALARDAAEAVGVEARLVSAALADYENARDAGYVDSYFPSVIEAIRKTQVPTDVQAAHAKEPTHVE
jgi:3-hydroxyisobutyrate dehydrogenase-like beta-hydroxyacid dehydrogenase